MINERARAGWDRLMRPVGKFISRSGISPNAVTLMGVALQAVAAALVVDGRILAAGLLGTFAGFFDAFDGAVAKARGMTTKFGGFLDSVTDRLADGMIFGAVVWLYGVDPDIAARDEPWVAGLALVVLVTSFLVSYVKARAESLGFECNVGIIERGERLILVNAGLILNLVPAMMVILAVLSVVTFFQRLLHVRVQAANAA